MRIKLIAICILLIPTWSDYAQHNSRTASPVVAFPNLSFHRPVDLQHAGDNTNRIFVVDQPGEIFVFDNESKTSTKKLFLDIKSKVDDGGNEEGLLGLAFHPDYKFQWILLCELHGIKS
jgi:hypothetical protein